MSNVYNIYRMKFYNLEKLTEKIESVGLKKQKSIDCDNYTMTFYFSENIQGNEIWWWQTYKEFFNDDTPEPKNIFYYGLLVSHLTNNPKFIYAVSLGKSHFYLSKLIESDFGIKLAVRMANENTILLKKSRYFAGTKRQDISSYEKFIKNSYEAGESVDHLKIKALNKEVWGEKNIIFADSVQMDMSIDPKGLINIFNEIEHTLLDDEIISLPKLEAIADTDLVLKLDSALLESILKKQAHVVIEEFETYGINFCFRFNEYEYEILTLENRRNINKKQIGNAIDINHIYDYFQEFNDIDDINKVKLKFKIDGNGVFTKPIKELLDFHIKDDNVNYFLKNGSWYSFNETFMAYLSSALNDIEIIKKDELVEADYLTWKQNIEAAIKRGEKPDTILRYREYYFNTEQAKHGYEVLDRECELINSLEDEKRRYKLEIADLYKDSEIISVKISDDKEDLIYNIEQSKDSLELIQQGTVLFDKPLTGAALWFVFKKEVNRITEFNSVQFLLAIESWRKRVLFYGLHPRIYISQHKT